VYAQAMPHYQLLIESYLKAQQVANEHEVLDSQR
ncbi:MAG: hydrolase, partial [Pseudomonas fluorescens]